MTTFETSQGFANIEGGYRVNVTTRLDAEHRTGMKELTEKTVKLWLAIAKKIAAGERKFDYAFSPESAMAKDKPEFAKINIPIAEPRVTVWGDVPGGSGFTVHSHSVAQDALDVYWSRYDALQGLVSPQETPKPQNPLSTQASQQPNADLGASGAKLAQSTNPSPSADGVTKVSGKKAARTLSNGSLFELPIYQVKLRSKDDSQYYEFYTKYGSKLGEYPEIEVYTDNEIAKTNGLLDFLGEFGLTPGKDKMGEWVLRGVVKDKGDKKNLYAVSLRSAA
jgi:hypothetical protein